MDMLDPMIVDGYRRSWQVSDSASLQAALAWRDDRNGGEFWLSHAGAKYPCLALRISGDVADVHYFATDGDPGFRLLAGTDRPRIGTTKLIFMGCDPGDGEETPNEFIVSSVEAVRVAEEFFRTRQVSLSAGWLEL